MKIIIKIFAIMLIFCNLASSANAQISTTDEKMVQQRIRERVKLMNDYISYMANKTYPLNTRKGYKSAALPLFINNCDGYEEDGIWKNGVIMQVTSVNRSSTSNLLTKKYFDNLINIRYRDVRVTSTEIANMKVSGLKQIGANKYVCTCQYAQWFYGYGADGRSRYGDKTTKRITCYVTADETEDGIEYIILLGDAQVISTENN